MEDRFFLSGKSQEKKTMTSILLLTFSLSRISALFFFGGFFNSTHCRQSIVMESAIEDVARVLRHVEPHYETEIRWGQWHEDQHRFESSVSQATFERVLKEADQRHGRPHASWSIDWRHPLAKERWSIDLTVPGDEGSETQPWDWTSFSVQDQVHLDDVWQDPNLLLQQYSLKRELKQLVHQVTFQTETAQQNKAGFRIAISEEQVQSQVEPERWLALWSDPDMWVRVKQRFSYPLISALSASDAQEQERPSWRLDLTRVWSGPSVAEALLQSHISWEVEAEWTNLPGLQRLHGPHLELAANMIWVGLQLNGDPTETKLLRVSQRSCAPIKAALR